MRRALLSILALAATANAAYQGFNYGNLFTDGRLKTQADYEAEFTTAANLEGTNGAFTSARLYTMIQGGTTDNPIEAIPAAINTGTSLLLGMWCSAGDSVFANELSALKKAISMYGSDLGPLVAGISVGSEDLYRITPTGIANGEYAGAGPNVLAGYIAQVREAIAGTPLSGARLGHVDTWTAWVNASNKAVIDAVDWVGMDAYPYFQKENSNGIDNGRQLFFDAVGATNGGTGGKELWITETGWPTSGEDIGAAVPSIENAKAYWDAVGCRLFGSTNVWWYTFQDTNPVPPADKPSFGVIGSELTTSPLYDLSCEGVDISDPTTSAGGPDRTEDADETGTGTGTTSPTGGSELNGDDSAAGDNDTNDATVLGQSLAAGVLAIMAAIFAL